MLNYSYYGIEVPNGKTAGEVQTLCPQCSHTRKKKTDKCLSVNLDKKTWFCHHCNWKGAIIEKVNEVKYVRPEWKNNTNLPDKVLKWFESRRISAETCLKLNISHELEYMPQINAKVAVIAFNYFLNGELVNVKYRDGRKNFKLHKDAELIPYNFDSVIGADEIWIVEGEMDCLSLIEVGINPVISVPNGASKNLQYFDRFMPLLDNVKKVHIAVDNDAVGLELRNTIAERFGKHRCDFIDWGDCKDANEYLMQHGGLALKEFATTFTEFPMMGVYKITDFLPELVNLYNYGLPEGYSTGMDNFDKLLKIHKGYLTTITGIPGHGKSDFLDMICMKLMVKHGLKGAFYSPENRPSELHISKMIRKLANGNFYGYNRLSVTDVYSAISTLDEHIFFVKPDNDFTLDSVLSLVAGLKNRRGIDYFVIDAWNKLEHQYVDSETKYIGQSLDKLVNFCERYNVHCFLVAHPRKIQKKDNGNYHIPTLYDIAGSANFFNKTDNGIVVYRDFESNNVEIHVQKVKFSHWGQVGQANFSYDIQTGNYIQIP